MLFASVAGFGAKPSEQQGVKADQPATGAAIAPFWVDVEVQATDGTLARLSALKLAPETKP